MQENDEKSRLKKGGFFSSVRHLVSDFTENIMKDFGDSEDPKGEIKSFLSNFPVLLLNCGAY